MNIRQILGSCKTCEKIRRITEKSHANLGQISGKSREVSIMYGDPFKTAGQYLNRVGKSPTPSAIDRVKVKHRQIGTTHLKIFKEIVTLYFIQIS